MMPKHTALVVAIGGPPPDENSGGGSGPKSLAEFPVPKGFDLSECEPGGEVMATAKLILSPDSKTFNLFSLDDVESKEDDVEDASETPESEQSQSPGDVWKQTVGKTKG